MQATVFWSTKCDQIPRKVICLYLCLSSSVSLSLSIIHTHTHTNTHTHTQKKCKVCYISLPIVIVKVNIFKTQLTHGKSQYIFWTWHIPKIPNESAQINWTNHLKKVFLLNYYFLSLSICSILHWKQKLGYNLLI